MTVRIYLPNMIYPNRGTPSHYDRLVMKHTYDSPSDAHNIVNYYKSLGYIVRVVLHNN